MKSKSEHFQPEMVNPSWVKKSFFFLGFTKSVFGQRRAKSVFGLGEAKNVVYIISLTQLFSIL